MFVAEALLDEATREALALLSLGLLGWSIHASPRVSFSGSSLWSLRLLDLGTWLGGGIETRILSSLILVNTDKLVRSLSWLADLEKRVLTMDTILLAFLTEVSVRAD